MMLAWRGFAEQSAAKKNWIILSKQLADTSSILFPVVHLLQETSSSEDCQDFEQSLPRLSLV